MIAVSTTADLLDRFRAETVGYHWEVGGAAVLAGVLLLVFGWNLYRPCLVVSGMLCGVALGTLAAYHLKTDPRYPALAGGLLLGLLAIPLVKAAMVLSSGAAGAAAVYALVQRLRWSDLNKGAVVVLAFVGCAVLSVWLFRLMVTFAFSVQGSTLVCAGWLITFQAKSPASLEWLYQRTWAIWLAFYVLFFIGMVMQITTGRWVDERREEKLSVQRAKAKVRMKYGKQKK